MKNKDIFRRAGLNGANISAFDEAQLQKAALAHVNCWSFMQHLTHPYMYYVNHKSETAEQPCSSVASLGDSPKLISIWQSVDLPQRSPGVAASLLFTPELSNTGPSLLLAYGSHVFIQATQSAFPDVLYAPASVKNVAPVWSFLLKEYQEILPRRPQIDQVADSERSVMELWLGLSAMLVLRSLSLNKVLKVELISVALSPLSKEAHISCRCVKSSRRCRHKL